MTSNKVDTKGKFIVIEGGDGSGKETQSKILIDYLEKKKIKNSYFDFPNYSSFYGKLIAKFLRGELGQLDEISPYLASLPFSLDRLQMKNQILSEVEKNQIVVVNRYVTSNMAHQGSKLEDDDERSKFLNWLKEMEYQINELPKPDLVIYLNLPSETATQLTEKKPNRDYLNGKKDIQEESIKHRKKTEEVYLELAENDSSWKVINCFENGTILTRDSIHLKIIEFLKSQSFL